jgi:hypothetical protein
MVIARSIDGPSATGLMLKSILYALALLPVWIVGEMVVDIIGTIMFAGFRRLYQPPYGRVALVMTWLAALVGFVAALDYPSVKPLLEIGLAVGLPFVALIALGVTRDAYRDAREQAAATE